MTRNQQASARLLWSILAGMLIAATYYNKPTIVLPSALIGWFGGIAFVYAWVAKVDEWKYGRAEVGPHPARLADYAGSIPDAATVVVYIHRLGDGEGQTNDFRIGPIMLVIDIRSISVSRYLNETDVSLIEWRSWTSNKKKGHQGW